MLSVFWYFLFPLGLITFCNIHVFQDKVKKIKDEAGNWIPATYKSKRYAQWKQRSKIDENSGDNSDDEDPQTMQKRNRLQGNCIFYTSTF